MTHKKRLVSLGLAALALTFTLAAGAAPQAPAKTLGNTGKPAAAAKAPATGLLDGQTFAGELDPRPTKGSQAVEKGEISFTGGQFHAGVCDERGFKVSSYTSRQEGKTIHFNSVLTSNSGKMIWKGKVTGKDIEADVRWEKGAGSPAEYHYKGAVKS